jgi:pimeloyl-ACP methyl ester carboxylesterase
VSSTPARSKTRRGYTSTSLGQVHYREVAGPSPRGADALLMMHQTADSSAQFAELLPELAGRVRAIAVDTPGYGDSDRLPASAEPPTIADYARAMSELLAALDIGRAAVLGTHTGAAIALELAASRPALVERLVLSGLPDYEPEERPAKIASATDSPPLDDEGGHLRAAWERAADPMWGRDDLAQITRAAVDSVRALPGRHYGPLAVFHFEGRTRIPLVEAPTLLLYGERDPFAERQPTLAALFADGRAERMDGAGASPMQHRPADYARRLLAFLEG